MLRVHRQVLRVGSGEITEELLIQVVCHPRSPGRTGLDMRRVPRQLISRQVTTGGAAVRARSTLSDVFPSSNERLAPVTDLTMIANALQGHAFRIVT